MAEPLLRPYDAARPADRAAVLDICVRTGAAGADASGLVDPRQLTDRYATPYLELEPSWAVLAEVDGAVQGYLLGTPDTWGFAARFGAWPSSLGPAEQAEHVANMLVPECEAYPAHLHVDLLPVAQGRGIGRALVEHFVTRLERDAPGAGGVHLGVDPANTGALAFYPRLGFEELRRDSAVVLFGRRLTPPRGPRET
ncbi:MAG: N-acetyltransferase [Herbiconiux sp.]|nr:N-acetyltransferase [Herbiconiux sp.]